MFYQHNPVAVTWENMPWGYAISDELIRWKEKEIVPFTKSLDYGTDVIGTFRKYNKNPLISQMTGGNRDSKVIYHEPTDQYIMALYPFRFWCKS